MSSEPEVDAHDAASAFELNFLDGFAPAVAVAALRVSCGSVPLGGGVYVVLAPGVDGPVFLEVSAGGRFKRKDPSVAVARLKQEWVDGTRILYVGKGGCLRARVKQLVDFAHGKPVGHWGGRLLWQIAGWDQFVITCRETPEESPAQVESRMLATFRDEFGHLPFANLVS